MISFLSSLYNLGKHRKYIKHTPFNLLQMTLSKLDINNRCKNQVRTVVSALTGSGTRKYIISKLKLCNRPLQLNESVCSMCTIAHSLKMINDPGKEVITKCLFKVSNYSIARVDDPPILLAAISLITTDFICLGIYLPDTDISGENPFILYGPSIEQEKEFNRVGYMNYFKGNHESNIDRYGIHD